MTTILITGTDTGVGKSHVAVGLLTALRARGRSPFAIKPIETGCDDRDAPEDGLRLAYALGRPELLSVVCPRRFALPAAPMTAAEREGVAIDPRAVMADVARAAALGDPLVIEGAGGLMVPIAEGFGFAELAQRAHASLVVVARDALGTLNHTLLTLLAAERYGLRVAAVVLNQSQPMGSTDDLAHAATLRRLCGARVLGPLTYGEDPATGVARIGLVDALA